jgi:hypothetical protein
MRRDASSHRYCALFFELETADQGMLCRRLWRGLVDSYS